jgi:hypothetical protein
MMLRFEEAGHLIFQGAEAEVDAAEESVFDSVFVSWDEAVS